MNNYCTISLGVTFILLSICARRVVAEETGRQALPPIQFVETYPFTKFEATYQVQPDGTLGKPLKRELVAFKSNPYYFGSDTYAPKTIEQGGPFTIGHPAEANPSQKTSFPWISASFT